MFRQYQNEGSNGLTIIENRIKQSSVLLVSSYVAVWCLGRVPWDMAAVVIVTDGAESTKLSMDTSEPITELLRYYFTLSLLSSTEKPIVLN